MFQCLVANGMFQCLVANGMFQCLVANGMFQAWWLMKCSNVWWPMECSNAWWLMEGEGKTPFHLFPLFPQLNLIKPSIFSFELKVLLYHGSRLLLTPFLPSPRSINYDFTSQCNKSFTPSLSIWFWLKIWPFSSPWNYDITHGHILWAPSRTNKWKTASGVISRFNHNTTSSW